MFMSCEQTVGQYNNSEQQFRFCGTTLKIKISFTNKLKANSTQGNAFYHSVQDLLSSSSLSKIIKIKMCRIIILPVVLHGCETWSLTLRVRHRLRVFNNRVLRKIFRPKRPR
jgi:hypothetical protein